ncbi:LOW QUALITY PROTEIN: hypothetical protein SORBI_3004G020500 [Sorghum bicolor]|uniref:Uncharacterized protein n=2 Tax=Sorghum bicolor TaxID=4558 RepID=A0A1Z5RKH6_SORBI|nr:LOW QUALITY PROTEIN: hypothetical protein SORBI_3004G020500 [Sorghum bicolor]
MESLSSVRTIMGIMQDILAAVETASRNKSRCKKLDILEATPDGSTSTAAAAATTTTRRLQDRLEEVLGRTLQVVRRYQRGGSSFLRSVIVVVAGDERMADPLDAVEAEIDRCILDLTVANSLRIARLETTLLVRQQQHNVAAVAAASTEAHNDKRKKKGSVAESVVSDKMMDDDHESTTAATAIGVPVYTVTAAAVHENEYEQRHEMVPPPPPPPCYWYGGYGYRSCHGYCYWRNHGGCACDCRCGWDDGNAGEPSDVAFYHTQYSSYPSMFSDDNPNSCSIL